MAGSVKKNSSWIVTAPLVGASLLYIGFVLLPKKRSMDELRASIQTKREYIGQAESLRPIIDRTERENAVDRKYVRAWQDRAPHENELAKVYAQINHLAHDAGATVTRFDPSESMPLEMIHPVTINVDLEGQFTQIYQFIAGIENLPETIWIERLHLEGKGGDRKNVMGSAKLVVFASRSEKSD